MQFQFIHLTVISHRRFYLHRNNSIKKTVLQTVHVISCNWLPFYRPCSFASQIFIWFADHPYYSFYTYTKKLVLLYYSALLYTRKILPFQHLKTKKECTPEQRKILYPHEKNPRCLTEIRQQGFFIKSSDCCDHFYLAENVLWQCLDCNTGTCRFVYEIFGIYFIKCRKIVHICKEAYCLDCILIAGTGSFQNCSEILHNTVSLLLDGCSNYLSSCRIHRDLTGCVKRISMDDSLGVWSDCCRCFVCMYCLHNRILLS